MAAAHRQGAPRSGVQAQVLEAISDAEIEAAYTALSRGTALLVGTDPHLLRPARPKFIALSARHAVPTMFEVVETARRAA